MFSLSLVVLIWQASHLDNVLFCLCLGCAKRANVLGPGEIYPSVIPPPHWFPHAIGIKHFQLLPGFCPRSNLMEVREQMGRILMWDLLITSQGKHVEGSDDFIPSSLCYLHLSSLVSPHFLAFWLCNFVTCIFTFIFSKSATELFPPANPKYSLAVTLSVHLEIGSEPVCLLSSGLWNRVKLSRRMVGLPVQPLSWGDITGSTYNHFIRFPIHVGAGNWLFSIHITIWHGYLWSTRWLVFLSE